MPEALLGFDARIVGPPAEALWPSERRATYLLRAAPLPFSVDEMVWPSVFRARDPLVTHQPWNVGWIERPNWVGPNGELWENLGQLEGALQLAPQAPPGAEVWKIAVTWHDATALRATGLPPYGEPTVPPRRPASWTLLGYDVADPGISGLMNCGYDAAEREGLIQGWSQRLNDHHLLTTLDDAYAFCTLTDQRVSEHAPFFVLGLWNIPSGVRHADE